MPTFTPPYDYDFHRPLIRLLSLVHTDARKRTGNMNAVLISPNRQTPPGAVSLGLGLTFIGKHIDPPPRRRMSLRIPLTGTQRYSVYARRALGVSWCVIGLMVYELDGNNRHVATPHSSHYLLWHAATRNGTISVRGNINVRNIGAAQVPIRFGHTYIVWVWGITGARGLIQPRGGNPPYAHAMSDYDLTIPRMIVRFS